MNLWHLERARIWRTHRIWILLGVFGFFGMLGPLTTRFLPELLESAGISGDVGLPPITPEFAMSQYLGNALQLGLLAVTFVAAASLAFDAKTEISVFYRTRASIPSIVAPRYTITALVSVAAFIVGTVVAFIATAVLIAPPPIGGVVAGSALIGVYLVFTVALTGLMASLVRSIPGAALLAVGSLIVLGLANLIPHIGLWLPSYLVGGFDALIAGGDFDYGRSIAMTLVASAGTVHLSIVLMRRREV